MAGTRGAATVREPFHRLLSRLTALAFFAAASAPVQAGCALCREAAASQRQEAIDALNLGILALGAPPFIILAAVGWAVWRRRF